MTEIRLAAQMSGAAAAAGEWCSLAEAIGVPLERIDRMAHVAWRLYMQRQHREAAAIFRGLTALDPENIDLYRGYALAAAAEQDLVSAIEAIDQAMLLLDGKEDRDLDRSKLLALRASFLFRTGRKAEAIADAELSVQHAPAASWAQSLSAGARQLQKASKRRKTPVKEVAAQLESMLQKRLALVQNKSRTLAWAVGYSDQELLKVFRRGAALLEAGHAYRARRVFHGLVSLDDRVPLFHLAEAASWDALDEPKRAELSYRRAVRHAREIQDGADLLADALLRRARHYAKRGATRRAIRDLDEALGLPERTVADDTKNRIRTLRAALARSAAS